MFYHKHKKIILPLIILPFIFIIWEMSVVIFNIPQYLLPKPSFLAEYMAKLFSSGTIVPHILITLKEILLGTLIGVLLGLVLGYIMAKIRIIEKLIMPLVVILQTAPKISLAPLFILWLGLGIESKIVLVVLVVMFPVMINEVLAIRTIDKNVYDLMSVLKSNKIQVFFYIELPYSFEMLISGIKLAMTQAVTGAVIGEMIGAKAGLGYLLTLGSETYDISMILSSVIILSFIGLFLYEIFNILENKVLYWKATDINTTN